MEKIGVFFDLEGTLIETGYQTNNSLLEKLHLDTCNKLLEYGIPENVLLNETKSIFLRKLSYEWIKENCFSMYDDFKEYVEDFMFHYDMTAAQSSKLYDETLQILTYLKNKKCKLGILTNTSKKAAKYMMNKHSISHYFDVILTRNDVERIKPDPMMLKKATQVTYTTVNFMVGDSKVDVLSTKYIPVYSILIKRNGMKPDYDLDYFITNLLELQKIIHFHY